ncbi:MAG: hypothetical protein M1814_000281 [Vezdaea aestivalis]|nr:MAG: hypothetical protein M1814_000281 [Vezdaea aestivalis]
MGRPQMKNPKAAVAYKPIVKYLRDTNLPHDEAVIAEAFRDQERAESALSWSNKWLKYDTLLTKEEYDLLEATKASGVLIDSLETFPPSSAVIDQELNEAIKTLNDSTKALKKQTSNVKVQAKGFKSLAREIAQIQKSNNNGAERRTTRRALEIRHTSQAADELVSDLLQACLSDRAKQIEVTQQQKDIETFVDALLKDDDQTLTGIQNTLSQSTRDQEENAHEAEARVEELGERLAHYKREAIQNKLDRLFMENLQQPPPSGEGKSRKSTKEAGNVTAKDLKALELELDALHAEIGDVAQIASAQEFIDPILQDLRLGRIERQAQEVEDLDQALTVLAYLTQKASSAAARIETSRAHQKALHALYSIAQTELAALDPAQLPTPSSPVVPRSPTRRRPSRTLSRANSASATDMDPESALLRSLGIFLPAAAKEGTESRPLESVVRDRNTKTLAALKALEQAVELGVKEHLGDAARTQAEVERVFWKDMIIALDLKIVSEQLEKRVDELESGVEDVSERMGKVDLKALGGREKAKETFVERWAR